VKHERVLLVGLDGYEPSVAERLMRAGRLPALRSLHRSSACLRLDHGTAKRTGLAWEHVSSGLSPDDAKRWAAVRFDPERYEVRQEPTALAPFTESLDGMRAVVFDPPYFDLLRTRDVEGLVSWGAHDPGVAAAARPAGLADEIAARFGRYPAKEFIYGFVWPSPDKARAMATALRHATELRGHIAEWLFCERLPQWDLGLLVVSEFHSAIEAMWHGIDPTHPLHTLPSSVPSREGIEGVYEAADAMIARLRSRMPDARIVVFSMHGMGANNADVASMALLGELMYRHAFDAPRMRDLAWPKGPGGLPMLHEGQGWSPAVLAAFDGEGLAAAAKPAAPSLAGKVVRRLRSVAGKPSAAGSATLSLAWMPVARYQPFWRSMPAFALPSFYDGRIRLNLAGREAQGIVAPDDYESTLDGIEAMLRRCRDVITRQPVVARIERPAAQAPLQLSATEADLIIEWQGAPLGFDHPTLGRIGPLPYRRTGGHTGRHGVAYVCGPGIEPGDYGEASAFDVVPTAIDLLDRAPSRALSGASWKARIAPAG
jgi:predicted AlkP superfamily phosphohydrolase/phosphomutase